MPRQLPNIIITGTPGVGKTTTAQALTALAPSLTHLSINKIARDQNLHDSYDVELDTHTIDEDKLLDHIETLLEDGEKGGFILDWHVCDIFPERWVDLVVVLRCEDTSVFYERLTSENKAEGEKRGYAGKKLEENVDAEIFGVVAEEAREGWTADGAVVELQSVNVEQIEENAERISAWVQQWVKDNVNNG